MSNNLYASLSARFAAHADDAFLDIPNSGAVTFADIDAQSGRLARLFGELGLKAGDRVTVQVEKSAAAVALYLACLRAGLVYNPLNSAYTANEVNYFVGDAEPGLLVCDPAAHDRLRPVATRHGTSHLLTLDAAGRGTLITHSAALAPTTEVVPRRGDDVAAIIYTSGTTGRSKGAMLTHENLLSNALTLHRLWGFEPGDVLLHALPIFHVHGLFVALHCALLNASRVIFLDRFDAGRIIELLPASTVMMGVPTFYTRLLAEPALTRERCAAMRLFVSGSAPLLPETFAEFEARTGHRILERYGMSEAGMIASNPLDGKRVPGTVGFALPDVAARVASAQGEALPAGKVGGLEITGPNVFKGYWRMPERTAQEFRDDGYFITGDLATMDADGRISIVGRAKDLIISGGYNIYPKEIEICVNQIDGVVDSAVFGVAHPDLGEAVTAAVCVKPGAELSEPAIIAALNPQLARFKLPKRIFIIDDLPRNTMGKVQKNVLRETYASLYQKSPR